MDFDGPSSPDFNLPPSSAPAASAATATTNRAGSRTPRSARRGNGNAVSGDALALDDIQQDNNGNGEEEAATQRRRARARGRIEGDVPLVRDAIGERITESFETFLKT